jgi:nickel-dependent lactate racemase
MKTFAVPYGKSVIQFHLPSTLQVDVIEPGTTTPVSDPAAAIQTTLAHPFGKQRLAHFPQESTVGIAINDKTRPNPQPTPLNFLLESLLDAGFSKQNIKLFIGSGTHTPMREEDFPLILSKEIIEDYAVVSHDCDHSPLVSLGKTSYNTPIFVNADYFKCDLKICVGNIEPHHFMGVSGGVKTAAIGLAGRQTITINHGKLTHPQAQSGVYYMNPMRQDLEEIGKKIQIHFTLGSIINEEKQIIDVFWGDPAAVMKAALPKVRQIFGKTVAEPYDLVIASPGGHPKDINLYQAQKGLTHAARITKDDGWVVLLAACPEGSGSQGYEDYIKKAKSHEGIIHHFRNGYFKVGPHKAFQIAREALRVNIIFVSDLPAKKVKNWKLTPSKPKLIDPLLEWFIDNLPPNPRIALLPAATRTMTEVRNDRK